MIINGASRKDGDQLAVYLKRGGQLAEYLQREGEGANERVEVIDIQGTIASDLRGALCEMDDLASASRCEKHLYHANINTHPHERLSPEQWRLCADRLGTELGFSERHQRVVVLHEKYGQDGTLRQHAHVVWNRVDGDSLKAVHMGWSFRDHERAARLLERQLSHRVVPGPHIDPDSLDVRREPLERLPPAGMEQVKAELTAAWQQTDSGRTWAAAIEDMGYVLARGDRRDFVVIDSGGEAHSPRRRVEGVKAKDIKARLSDIDPETLPTVKEALALQEQRRFACEGTVIPAVALQAMSLIGQEGRGPDPDRNSLPSEIWAVETDQERLVHEHVQDFQYARQKAQDTEWKQEQVAIERDAIQKTLNAYDCLSHQQFRGVPQPEPKTIRSGSPGRFALDDNRRPPGVASEPVRETPERSETLKERYYRKYPEWLKIQRENASCVRVITDEKHRLWIEKLQGKMDAKIQEGLDALTRQERDVVKNFKLEQHNRIAAEKDRLAAERKASLGFFGRVCEKVADLLNPARIEQRERALWREAEISIADDLKNHREVFESLQFDHRAAQKAAMRRHVWEAFKPEFQELVRRHERDRLHDEKQRISRKSDAFRSAASPAHERARVRRPYRSGPSPRYPWHQPRPRR
jgi:hypothetical protein